MAKTKTSFDGTQKRTSRGLSDRTKILNAMKRAGKTENGFYDFLVSRALDVDDNFALKEVLARISPLKKAVMPSVEFDFDVNTSPASQVSQLLDAASKGEIPPDIASTFIQSVKAAVDIEEATDLKERIESLEKLLNERSS